MAAAAEPDITTELRTGSAGAAKRLLIVMVNTDPRNVEELGAPAAGAMPA